MGMVVTMCAPRRPAPFMALWLFALLAGHQAAGAAPARVVSTNVCTDQLAMLVAADGQLYSVSKLASDPQTSVLASEARRYVVNHGFAEEVFAMHPDLVLAGSFTTRAGTAMLRRVGVRVEEFAPASSFAEIREQIARLGRLLDRREKAEELIAELDRGLSAVPGAAHGKRPLAALHYANSYTSGIGTLPAEAVERAGLENLGSRFGIEGTGKLPLEVLVMAAPDLVVGESAYRNPPALAHQTYTHPALRAVIEERPLTGVPDKYWVCGAPFTVEAVRLLAAAASSLENGKKAVPRP